MATSSEIQVTEAYIGLLGRAPDPAGLAYWTAELDAAIAAGNGNVRLETLPDGHHMDTWLQSGYTKRVRSFLTDYHLLER